LQRICANVPTKWGATRKTQSSPAHSTPLILNVHRCEIMPATIAFPMIIVAGIGNIRAATIRTLSTIWWGVCKVFQNPTNNLTHSINLLSGKKFACISFPALCRESKSSTQINPDNKRRSGVGSGTPIKNGYNPTSQSGASQCMKGVTYTKSKMPIFTACCTRRTLYGSHATLQHTDNFLPGLPVGL